MLLNNYAIRNAGQSRALGGQLDPTRNFNLAKMNTFYAQDSSSLAPFQTNLVKNGDFEFAPPFAAATTTVDRWIDGTAAGSLTNFKHEWVMGASGSAKAQFDNSQYHSGSSSLKVSTTAITSYVEVYKSTGQYGKQPYFGKTIPILPLTSYTYSFWMKTNYVSGDATRGAYLALIFSDSTGASNGSCTPSILTTGVKTTQDWTQYTGTFTTTSVDAYLQMNCRIYGHQGTGTLIMDAWFDDISITLTNQVTRSSTDNNPQYFSQPAQGLRPPYSLVLAPKAGGMSMWNGGTGSTTGTGIQGLFGEATLAGSGTVSDAAAGLIVEMIATIAGLGGLTADVIGQLEASATLAGSGSLTAAQSALAGMTATLIGTGLISDAQQQALGDMQAEIFVNQSQATIEQIADAVVQAIVDMGATGGLTSEEHTQLMKTLTTGKFIALK